MCRCSVTAPCAHRRRSCARQLRPASPAPRRYMFDQLTKNGYRIANTEPNLRCSKKLDRGCMSFIEYSLVKTDDGGNVILAQQ